MQLVRQLSQYQPHSYTLCKVVLQCTSGSLPGGFVADLKQAIDHHNAGEVDIAFTCQDTIQVSAIGWPRGNCLVAIATSPHVYTSPWIYSGYPGWDSPVLDGSQDEPPCPHCLFGPCIIQRPPVFLTGRAAPSLANDRKRFRLYQQFWQLLRDLGLWDHPTYLGRKGLVTHPSDRREIMPICVQNVNNSTYLVEGELIISFPHRKSEADIQIL